MGLESVLPCEGVNRGEVGEARLQDSHTRASVPKSLLLHETSASSGASSWDAVVPSDLGP